MKVLGIDPGFRKTGYAVIKKIENKILVVEYGLIKTNIKE
ncbi:crossover junction endodeoxyribonuclease RuvC, partial [candidate division TA06 bacterium]